MSMEICWIPISSRDELARLSSAKVRPPRWLHQSVKVLGLSMAATQGGNGSNIVTIFVAFDDDCELSRSFHEAILTERPKPYPPSFSKNKQIV